jgi:hypothetical protein
MHASNRFGPFRAKTISNEVWGTNMWRSFLMFLAWIGGGILFTQAATLAVQYWVVSVDHHVHPPVTVQASASPH